MAELATVAPTTAVSTAVAPATSTAWSPARRFLFRFSFLYFVLYLFPAPLESLPVIKVVNKPVQWLWNLPVAWVGEKFFGLEVQLTETGSGDTTHAWVQALCILVLALVGALVWTRLDRKRVGYPRLAEWFRIYLRFCLAVIMIGYGAAKFIPSQFIAPGLERLLQPFGDASPMGLLWTFMGASRPYTVFAGAMELVGGLLLTLRRTALLGALVNIAVLSNVLMLNLSYDVPVKLYSFHLLLIAVLIALPDLERLANLFLFNRGVEPAPEPQLFARHSLRRAAWVVGVAFVVFATGSALWRSHEARTTYGDLAPRSPLYGVWNVVDFELDGQVLPPLATDERRWERVVFDGLEWVGIKTMGARRRYHGLALDLDKGTLHLTRWDKPDWAADFTLTRPEPDRLELAGVLDGQKVRAHLSRAGAKPFLLRERGFHWIAEYPFNR